MAKQTRSPEEHRAFMLETPVPRLVSSLAVPTIASMLVTAIYNMADTYFVSQINNSASGAVGVVFSIMTIIQAVGFTIGMGSGSVAAQLMGKGELKRAHQFATTAGLLGLLCGLAVTTLGLWNLEWLLWEMGATPTIFPYAMEYARYILIGAPFMILSFILNNLMRWQGKANRSAIGMCTGGILNMVLDPIFIFGLDLGIAGAAIATIISQMVSFTILASFFVRGESDLHIRPAYLTRDWRIYWGILKSGMPSFLRQGVLGMATIVLNRAAGPYGDAAVAAMTVVTKVFAFFNSALIGFGQGFQPVVGYNYGAGRLDRVGEAVKFSMKVCTIAMTVMAAAGWFLAPAIVAAFRDDPMVIEIGVRAFRFQCLSVPFWAILVFANMLFQSLGCAWRAAFLAVCKQGVCFIPVVLVLSERLGLTGVEMSQMVADFITAAVSAGFLLHFFLKEFGKKQN